MSLTNAEMAAWNEESLAFCEDNDLGDPWEDQEIEEYQEVSRYQLVRAAKSLGHWLEKLRAFGCPAWKLERVSSQLQAVEEALEMVFE